MTENGNNASSRRDFLNSAGSVAGVSVLSGIALPPVHAAGSDTLQIALIGCGGRGTGAAENAMQVNSPVKVVAMADVFPQKLNNSHDRLKTKFSAQVDVPESRKFLGFDAYKKAMDSLKKGDIAILATPPAFRWVQFGYAIERGLHSFMEKPVTVDGPTTRKMFKLHDLASQKKLKVGVGLMVRHCRGRQELQQRIRNGQIGDIVAMRAYRMSPGGGMTTRKPDGISEVMFQIQKFHSFLWASGGLFSDFFIHQIDECSMMKGSWPVEAHGIGGRHYRKDYVDQNFDTYSVEFTYPDGTKLFYGGRVMPGCHDEFSSYVHGSKGSAVVSTHAHTPGRPRIYKGQVMPRLKGKDPVPADSNLVWSYPQPEKSPYQYEWDDLIEAIRQDKPYNEARRGAEASLVTSMGRMAAHTGNIVTFDQILNCDHEFAPDVDKMTADGPAPVMPKPDGTYPVPQPGILKNREY